MDSFEQKVDEIHRVLSGDPAERLALALVKALSALTGDRTSFLSYRSLSNLIKSSTDSPELLRSVAVLSSPRLNVLKPMFVYIAADGEEIVLSARDWTAAKREGFLVDPHSGEKITDFDKLVFPYFQSTTEFQKLAGSKK
ncbi:hypothetical protein [Mesorhizobium sp.]|uniref:hypothetical protein n=1 Tax=Mesorhizobium sp. TaxID=1871066 RepID=UPI000FE9AB08|nr:hypothetical protein [Mesorhizobium sp.]RWN54140.1 MAG: hypothetical protein EOS00_29075 [Mesorhizobium sp.]